MKAQKIIYGTLIGLLWVVIQPSLAADNMRFHGALVAEPCIIPPGDEKILLDFGTVIDKYLYLNTRTNSQPFEIRLTECDLSLGKTVKVTFSGKENLNLPGLLALEAGSQANGIGIGMETEDGTPLLLNKQGPGYKLVSGANTLTIRAYVKGEPKAIADQTIERGPFNAIATFSLEYE
jgi:type 1 fimbria pilin